MYYRSRGPTPRPEFVHGSLGTRPLGAGPLTTEALGGGRGGEGADGAGVGEDRERDGRGLRVSGGGSGKEGGVTEETGEGLERNSDVRSPGRSLGVGRCKVKDLNPKFVLLP